MHHGTCLTGSVRVPASCRHARVRQPSSVSLPEAAWFAKFAGSQRRQEPNMVCPAPAGSVLDSTFISPSLWLEPFLPTKAVEPVLPDPDAPDDPVAFKEVSLAEAQVCCWSCAAAALVGACRLFCIVAALLGWSIGCCQLSFCCL